MARTTRRYRGGSRRRAASRKNRGVFETVYSPVHYTLNTGRKVLRTGLKTGINVPVRLVKGARNTVSNSVNSLLEGVDQIGHNVFVGANHVVKSAFSRRRRNSRRAQRKSRAQRR